MIRSKYHETSPNTDSAAETDPNLGSSREGQVGVEAGDQEGGAEVPVSMPYSEETANSNDTRELVIDENKPIGIGGTREYGDYMWNNPEEFKDEPRLSVCGTLWLRLREEKGTGRKESRKD